MKKQANKQTETRATKQKIKQTATTKRKKKKKNMAKWQTTAKQEGKCIENEICDYPLPLSTCNSFKNDSKLSYCHLG